MATLTKEHIGLYQHQDKCFTNKITYYTNVISQAIEVNQEYNQKCALAEIMLATLASGTQTDIVTVATFIRYLATAVPEYDNVIKQISEFYHTAQDNNRLCSEFGEKRFCLIQER
jgi:hypothetical protein